MCASRARRGSTSVTITFAFCPAAFLATPLPQSPYPATTTFLPAYERLVVIAIVARADSPVPWTLSNSRFIGVSFTAKTGYFSSPSAAIARSRWTPVVVSSAPPTMVSMSSGWSSWIAYTMSIPSSTVIVGPWLTTDSIAA